MAGALAGGSRAHRQTPLGKPRSWSPSQLWNTKRVGCATLGSVDGDMDGWMDRSVVVWVRLKDECIDTCMMCLGVDDGETGGWVKG